MMKTVAILILLNICSGNDSIQTNVCYQYTGKEFVAERLQIAIDEYQRTKIPINLKIAQAALESGWGKSRLATKANNEFGIKARKGFKKIKAAEGWFTKYDDLNQSWEDHSNLLLAYYKPKENTFSCWLDELTGKYAEDPNYKWKIKNIARYAPGETPFCYIQ